MKSQTEPAPSTPPPAPAPVAGAPADPVAALQNKATNAVLGFVKNHPWRALGMVAAAGAVYFLCGRKTAV